MTEDKKDILIKTARHMIDRKDTSEYSANVREVARIALESLVNGDKERLDWLCSKAVEVRDPMVYGSHYKFHAQCDSDDHEPYHTTLRSQIDEAMKGES